MKKLNVDAVIVDLRRLTEETLAAYDGGRLSAVLALTNPKVQALLTQYGVRMEVVRSISCEDEVEMSTVNGKMTLDGMTAPEKKQVMVVNGKLFLKPDAGKVLDQYLGIVVNGKLYCPASLTLRVAGRCVVNGKLCTYPDDAVLLNSTVRLDRNFLLRAQAKLYWAENTVIATDPKLDAEALAAKGTTFASRKAILTESNAGTLAPLFTEDTELVILPDGTAVLDDDTELSHSLLHRCGNRLYIMGDVTIPEDAGELLGQIGYLHVESRVTLPAALEERFCAIPDLDYSELRPLCGHTVVGKPGFRLGKEMLELYPEGITCADCAAVQLDAALEPDTIQRKIVFDGCAVVSCTARQESAVASVSKDVAQIRVTDAARTEPETDEEARLDALCLTL